MNIITVIFIISVMIMIAITILIIVLCCITPPTLFASLSFSCVLPPFSPSLPLSSLLAVL